MKKFFLFLIVIVFVAINCKKEEDNPSNNNNNTAKFKLSDFESAQSCSTCHPQYYDEWSGSMHRYSTSDPIWMLANNSLQQSTNGTLKSTCFQCHSPIGFLTGNTPATFQFSDLKPLVREGINCDVCHTLRAPHTTTNGRIAYNIQPGRIKYGQISDPIPAGGAHESGYDISYERSEVCRTCHDLISNGVPVEITFTEWQNSPWAAMSVECQNCHMQTYTGQAAVGGPVRNNLHRHDMVGVDVAFGDFPNKPQQRAAVDSLLKNSCTMTVVTPSSVNANDSLQVLVNIYNDKTGHNLPTSVFFFRQMWIEVTASKGSDTIFRSGHLDANGDLLDTNSAFPARDRNLALFAGTLYKHGEFSNVFEMDSLVNNSIPPFESRLAKYNFKIPTGGSWNVKVRLLFRPFGPYLLRAVGAQQYLSDLVIFEMEKEERVIVVQ
ncbi:MAG: hypothetical protein KGZ58_12325 [Ignavibacteriales bacterium]|nr:hypothetical protein [Ignavibacteriales bacterium]